MLSIGLIAVEQSSGQPGRLSLGSCRAKAIRVRALHAMFGASVYEQPSATRGFLRVRIEEAWRPLKVTLAFACRASQRFVVKIHELQTRKALQ
jgi:hypothetical protein